MHVPHNLKLALHLDYDDSVFSNPPAAFNGGKISTHFWCGHPTE